MQIQDILAPFLVEKLLNPPFEIRKLFPVQTECLLRLKDTSHSGDLLVSAATGSGKTFAFALPILQSLVGRVVCRVRAVIVTPTRDLAAQVKRTFDDLCVGENLKVALVVGASSFAVEQAALVHDNYAGLADLDSNSLHDAYDRWSSKVDIVVATPGRLVDHVTSTPGFTLDYLEFLVIDEADRLMNQHYQGWLDVVYKHMKPYVPLQTSIVHRRNDLPVLRKRVRKLLFSATMTRNPEKLESLKLHNPMFVTVSQIDDLMIESDPSSLVNQVPEENAIQQTSLGTHQFTIPSTLREEYQIVEAERKPLALLHHLLQLSKSKSKSDQSSSGILVFVKSVQSASRLASLLTHASKNILKVTALSSDTSPATRKQILSQFTNFSPETNILICTDLIGRGIDLNESVATIINYDIPSNLKTYIHRIGRTARAGRHGSALSFVETPQTKWWRRVVCHGDVGRSRDVVAVDCAEVGEELEKAYGAGLEFIRMKYGRRVGGIVEVSGDSKKRKVGDGSSSSESSSSSSVSSSSSTSSTASDIDSSSAEDADQVQTSHPQSAAHKVAKTCSDWNSSDWTTL